MYKLSGKIDTTNAPELEASLTKELPSEIDASELEYISSAGLRALLKLRKSVGGVTVHNVTPDVYEIFEVTGFTEILNVKKALREISIEGCEIIGEGGYGSVYRLDDESIVKVYRSASLEFIDKERELSKKAFLLGIPTAIPFDTVKVGDSYGVIYEMLEAKTVSQLISEDPSSLKQLGQLSAVALKKLHDIEADNGDFPNKKKTLTKWVMSISQYIEPEETNAILNYIFSIPNRYTFLHGDYNSKNVMVKDGEVLLIDIGDAAVGHPAFDIAGLMLPYLLLPNATEPKRVRSMLGFDPALAQDMWGVMCGTYFMTGDADEIHRIADMLMPLAFLLMTYHSFHYATHDEDAIKERVERLIRGRLLPAIKHAKKIDF